MYFCITEKLGTATLAPTECYDRVQTDAACKLRLSKKEVHSLGYVGLAPHRAAPPFLRLQVMRLFGRPDNKFCWTQLIRRLLANPDLVDLPAPMVPEPQPRPSEMLRTLRGTYNGPAYRPGHTQPLPMLPPLRAAV